MVAARQEVDLRPQLERLDRLILRSEGIAPGALTFAFRPLWQVDAATAANVALAKAQATAVYAGLKLWPAATTARLAAAQLAEDGTYPGAEAAFAEAERVSAINSGDTIGEGASGPVSDFSPDQPRDPQGRWTTGGGGSAVPLAPAPGHPIESGGPSEPPVTATPSPEIDPAEGGQGGAHAPEGTPITPAAFGKGRGRALARALGTLLGAASRLMRQWRPDEPDGPQPTPTAPAVDPGSPNAEPPSLTMEDLARVKRGFAGRKSAQKWLNQMNNRGWTPEQIEEAVAGGKSFPAPNRITPENGAVRYVHPQTGKSVVIDDTTGRIIQLGGGNFEHY